MKDELRGRVCAMLHTHHVTTSLSEEHYTRVEDAIVALLEAERTRALGAAGDVVRQTIDECKEEGYVAFDTLESVLIERIHSLIPTGWTAVRTEDIVVVREAAENSAEYWTQQADWNSERGYDSSERDCIQQADAIRAALGRVGS